MPSLVEKLPHYNVKQLPCTCSMFEIGDFSTMHSLKYSIEYQSVPTMGNEGNMVFVCIFKERT